MHKIFWGQNNTGNVCISLMEFIVSRLKYEIYMFKNITIILNYYPKSIKRQAILYFALWLVLKILDQNTHIF